LRRTSAITWAAVIIAVVIVVAVLHIAWDSTLSSLMETVCCRPFRQATSS